MVDAIQQTIRGGDEPPARAAAPTASELRRNAIYNNYRALVDANKLAGVYPSVPEALAAFDAVGESFVAAGTITLAGEVAGLLR